MTEEATEATEIEVHPESVTETANAGQTDNAKGTQQSLTPTEDEALEAILGSDDTTEERSRDGRGRFAAKAPDPEADPETDTAEPAADASADSVNPDRDRAFVALRRDGVPDKILKTMTDEEIVAWGSKRAEVQANGDRLGAEYAQLKGSTKTQDIAPDAKDSPVAEPNIDIESAIEPFVEAYGEESREPLQKLAKALTGQMQSQIKPVIEALQGMYQDNLKAAAFEARTSLEKTYPQLGDTARHAEIADTMEMLFKGAPAKFDSVDKLMTAACKYCFADEQSAELKNKLAQQHEKRRNAAPSKSTSKNGVAPGRRMDQDDEVLGRIFEGDIAGARAVVSRG